MVSAQVLTAELGILCLNFMSIPVLASNVNLSMCFSQLSGDSIIHPWIQYKYSSYTDTIMSSQADRFETSDLIRRSRKWLTPHPLMHILTTQNTTLSILFNTWKAVPPGLIHEVTWFLPDQHSNDSRRWYDHWISNSNLFLTQRKKKLKQQPALHLPGSCPLVGVFPIKFFD